MTLNTHINTIEYFVKVPLCNLLYNLFFLNYYLSSQESLQKVEKSCGEVNGLGRVEYR